MYVCGPWYQTTVEYKLWDKYFILFIIIIIIID